MRRLFPSLLLVISSTAVVVSFTTPQPSLSSSAAWTTTGYRSAAASSAHYRLAAVLVDETILVDAAPTKMPGDVVDSSLDRSSSSDTKKSSSPPSLGALQKLLPKSVFQVDTKTSLSYFAADLAAVVLSMTALHTYITTDFYHSLPWPVQAATVVPLQLLTGFAMWCTWCTGHDCVLGWHAFQGFRLFTIRSHCTDKPPVLHPFKS